MGALQFFMINLKPLDVASAQLSSQLKSQHHTAATSSIDCEGSGFYQTVLSEHGQSVLYDVPKGQNQKLAPPLNGSISLTRTKDMGGSSMEPFHHVHYQNICFSRRL